MARHRLDHVDAMRPVKQAGVISTHTVLYFAPAAASTGSGAALLLHVSREGFFFISACMLAYACAAGQVMVPQPSRGKQALAEPIRPSERVSRARCV
jgi:hypothetical protein